MLTRVFLSLSLCCAMTMTSAAQVGLGYDLIEINASPNPLHPGIDHFFEPSSTAIADSTGLMVADVNKDGWLDLLICGREGKPNEFYVNNANGTFTESAALYGIQETSRRRSNALFFDLDNDGDLDLITLGFPGQTFINLDLYSLYRNDGAPGYGFTDITASSGGFALAETQDDTTLGIFGTAAVTDYDRDGYLDVFVTYWNNNIHTNNYGHDQARLWHNVPNPDPPEEGQLDYTPRLLVDATVDAQLGGVGDAENIMPTFTDFNRDGWPDMHINSHAGEDELKLNLRNGSFGPNIATGIGMNYNSMGHDPWGNEMGTEIADYDNDGDLDVYLTNNYVPGSTNKADAYYRNDSDFSINGSGLKFTHIGPVVGTDAITGNGWGALFVDMDNDCDRDLLIARGLGLGVSQNYVWANLFPALAPDALSVALQNVSPSCSQFAKLGATKDNGRSAVAFDYDNDGDLDVAYTRSPKTLVPLTGNRKTAFFRNTLSNGKPSLQVSLENSGGSLNTVGALVYVRAGGPGGVVQMADDAIGSSFLSQRPERMHFGLGSAAGADWVAVRWFDGSQQVVLDADGPPLAGFRTVTHAAHDDTGDLDGDRDTDSDDLALFVTNLVTPGTLDAISPDWPWRLMADADGNGLVDKRDLTPIRSIVGGPWASLGNGLAGISGVPTLTGTGSLVGGTPMTVTLDNARAGSSWWLIIGLDLLAAKLKGGVLLPDPLILIGPLPTLGGTLPLGGTWPLLPPGLQLDFQGWVQDAAAVHGFAATNGLSALTP